MPEIKPLNTQKLIDIWKKDSQLSLDVVEESRRIYELHGTYVDIWRHEKEQLAVAESEMKVLKRDKHEFYLHGASKETQELGWELPPTRVLRSDLDLYMEADKQIQELNLKIEKLRLNVELLKKFLDVIGNRQYNIGNIMKQMHWLKGA